jgi:hypothetical protein
MNLHEPVSFRETSFRETQLAAESHADTGLALASLLNKRAFFVTGAGSSAGAPTGLPTGPQLAERLVAWAEDSGLSERMATLEDRSDLGEVCEALNGALGRGMVVRKIGEAVDWEGTDPNLCHLAIAILFGEEAVSISFTVNWDPKLGDAFERVAGRRKPWVAHNAATMSMANNNDPRLIHLHGLWPDAESLVMTSKELDENAAVKWTDPQLRTSLSSGGAILVGFAAEPTYVLKSLSEMRELMDSPPSSVIGREEVDTFTAESPGLAEAIRLNEDLDRYVQGDACEVLGELLRCYYRKRVETVIDAAAEKAQAAQGLGAKFSMLGRQRLEEALGDLSLEDLLGLLWSSTARVSEEAACRQRTIAAATPGLQEILACVMVLAGAEGVRDLSASRFGFRLETGSRGLVELWPIIPENQLSPSDARVRAFQHSDLFGGPADAEVPLVLVCGDTVGAIPKGGKVSLVGEGRPESVGMGRRTPIDTINLFLLDERLVGHEGPIAIEEALAL